MKAERSQINYRGWAFIPLLVFLLLYVGCGIVFTLKGVKNPFDLVPRCVAASVGICLAFLCYDRKTSLDDKLAVYTKGAGRHGVMLLSLIVLLAGGFQAAAAKIGAQDAIVNMGIHYIPMHFIVPGIFLIAAIISTATGTSLGTQVAIIPVAIALAQGAHLNLAMAGAAAIAGAYFGDAVSFISSTLISAASGLNTKLKQIVKLDLLIAIPAIIGTLILYTLVSGHNASGEVVTAGAYHVIDILPYVIIIGASVAGMSVIYTLLLGLISTGLIGIATGSVTVFQWTKAIGAGMDNMFFLVVFSSLVAGLIQLIEYYGGIDWLLAVMNRKIEGQRSCEYLIAGVTGAISGATLNNTVAVIISAPIAEKLGDQYQISRTRIASLMTVCASAILSLIPYDSSVLLAQQYGGVSYIELMQYSYYPVIVLLVVCVFVAFRIGGSEKTSLAVESTVDGSVEG